MKIFRNELMKRFFTMVMIAFASLSFANSAVAQLQWRTTTGEISTPSSPSPQSATDGIEITSKDGNIIVKVPHKAQVKVFTILGQLVSQAELNPGTSVLKLNSRGIYIVKVGNVTQKVAM